MELANVVYQVLRLLLFARHVINAAGPAQLGLGNGTVRTVPICDIGIGVKSICNYLRPFFRPESRRFHHFPPQSSY
jgi:hypothetical protein